MGRVLLALLVSVLLLGCGEDGASQPAVAAGGSAEGGGGGSGGFGGCDPGQLELDGVCVEAGLPDDGCPPGYARDDPLDDQSACLPAGVPPGRCGQGFEPDGDHGCEAILPAEPCAGSLMALPGETQCRDVAPCAEGTFGSIPVEPDTQHVDASYGGGSSDGSQAQPWTTVQEAVDAAAPGAIVAIAAGSYAGEVSVADKAVRLWGRCPAMVELVATGQRVLTVGAGADGTEVRDLAMTGSVSWSAVQVADATDVLFERIWLHDTTGSRGMDIVEGTGTGTSVTLVNSLLHRTRTTAIMVWGAELTMERTVVRDTQPSLNSGIARGLNVAVTDTATPSSATVHRCAFLRNGNFNVSAFGSTLEMSDTLIRETRASAGIEDTGHGLLVQHAMGYPAVATVKATVIEQSRAAGLSVLGSDIALEGVVVRDTEVEPASGLFGFGIMLRDSSTFDRRSHGAFRFTLVERAKVIGVGAYSASLELHGVRVRGIRSSAAEERMGVGLYADVDEGGVGPTVAADGSLVADCRGAAVHGWSAAFTLDRVLVQGTRPAGATDPAGQALTMAGDEVAGPSTLELTNSLIEDNTTAALNLWGSDADVARSVLRQTASDPASGRFGDGVLGYLYGGRPSHLSLTATVLDGHQRTGVLMTDSTATIDGCVVQNIAPQTLDGLLGDGLSAVRFTRPTDLAVANTRVELAARAGVTSFGAAMSLSGCLLRCTPIYLNGEPLEGNSATMEDLGGNVCECGGETEACRLLSSSLQPPAPMDEPDPDAPIPSEGW